MGLVGEILEIAFGALLGFAGDSKKKSTISQSESGRQGYDLGQEVRKSYENKMGEVVHGASDEHLRKVSKNSDLNSMQRKAVSDEMKKRGL